MENVDLAYNEYVSDYIISWKLIASLQVQIAENGHLYKVLRDLLSPEGSEIQLEAVSRYVAPARLERGVPLDFDELARHLRSFENVLERRVLLGYVKGGTGAHSHVLCPKRNAEGRRMVSLGSQDMLIVIRSN